MHSKLFFLCAGIAAGARDLQEMPRIAAPQQLLSILARLAEVVEAEYADSFLTGIAREIENSLLALDEEGLYDFLEQLAVRFAREARER